MINTEIGILLVLYNDKDKIGKLLQSLHVQSLKNFRIYSIDNYGDNRSIDLIKTNFPGTKFLTSQGNIGFAKANNLLAKKAIDDGCKYLFVLNPDMELAENTIETFYNLMESDKSIGVCSSVILYGNEKKDKNIIQLYGQKINFSTQNKKMLFSNELLVDVNLPGNMEVDFVNAGSLFIRSDAVSKIGLFNADYFMYNDEIDLAFRLKKAKYKVLVTSYTKIWHHHDWTKNNKEGYYLMYYYMIRNRMLFFKNYKKYVYLFLDIFLQIITFPIKIKWLTRISDFKLVKFYYLGLWRGLLGETGKTNISFVK